MGRTFVALGLSVAIQAGALSAPLVHAHGDDHPGAGHRGRHVHAHVAGSFVQHGHAAEHAHPGAATIAIDAGEEPGQSTALQVFVAECTHAFLAPAVPPARFAVAQSCDSVMPRRLDVVRSHGPPGAGPSEPRAPPVSPVLI